MSLFSSLKNIPAVSVERNYKINEIKGTEDFPLWHISFILSLNKETAG